MKLIHPTLALGLALGASVALAQYKQDHLCVDGTNRICNILPADLDGLAIGVQGYTPSTDRRNEDQAQQINFDYFGWQSFAALNAPADASGRPIGVIGSAPEAPRVWESFAGVDDVFPGNAIVPDICDAGGRMTLARTSKVTTSSFIQPMTPYPLIDAAGNFVLYDVRINDAAVGYLEENGLTTKAGQQAFADAGGVWDFPRGKDGVVGAIEVKTSWRLLENGDNPLGYFTLPVTVVVAAEDSASGAPMCLEEIAGLTGMHIMQKVATPEEFAEFWIWASFEHASNAPLAKGAPISQMDEQSTLKNREPAASCPIPDDAAGPYAFFDAACTDGGAACTPNAPPVGADFKWQAQMPYGGAYLFDDRFGTQVVRCWDLYATGQEVNARFKAALAGTIWENYDLIGVQWANDHGDYYAEKMKPFAAPIYMVNSTLETYLQINPVLDAHGGLNRDRPSSCINCHDMARDAIGNHSNFSFLGGYAK
ncbi:hypothetical protein BOO69_05785 [Sulfitobacter alexandrii]|uniref:Cytochrome c family protein n=1 Tax=Sulfitobacter alexandrii TaxID=1917485 RepID=A0A1J0WF91_9RHOB|nr:hypothetical protein [Sulfitobacter alexandrii]APE42985.1 hypothetical protein BOO69_05785 [Sulfitobacter alexandrii]